MTETSPVRNMPVTVHAQYIKDMSFENPGAPLSFRAEGAQPGMNLNINVGVQDIQDPALPNLFEVSLRMQAHATRGDKTSFIAEVEYAAAVTLGDEVPEDAKHPLLLIEIPRMLFPFGRMMLSQMSQQGGYPALNISPVDFQALYIQKFAAGQEAEQSASPAQATAQ